jgi:hypothetical protein
MTRGHDGEKDWGMTQMQVMGRKCVTSRMRRLEREPVFRVREKEDEFKLGMCRTPRSPLLG